MSDPRRLALDTPELERALAAIHSQSFGWALACCDWNADEAADVLQASYLKILDGRARFEGRSQLSTFLYGVIRRTSSERRRRHNRRRLLLERHFAETGPATAQPPVPADVDGLRVALSALPARQREVLHLVFYSEMPIREAADVMGVALGTARIHYERGKKRLRELLAVEEDRR